MHRRWRPLGLLFVLAPWIVVATGSNHVKIAPHVAAAWRKYDAKGRACVSCHSPDGLEIAAYAFSDEDIFRRATAHVTADEARQIVEMIHGVRKQYHISKLLDPMTDLPMQPGGAVLVGNSPMDRDAAFAATLPNLVPLMFGSRIGTLAAAKAARDQVLSVNLDRLKIGIPLDRLSEDVFHGNEHASIADWIPDVPLSSELPTDIQDAYLASPSKRTYDALDHALAEIAPRQPSLSHYLSVNKRRSLLYLQHNMRMKLLNKSEPVRFEGFNPMWNIGDFGRQFAEVSVSKMGLPEDIAAKKVAGPDSKEQLKQLRLSWMWLGWCMDPGLQKTSPFTETMRADYFSRLMWSDGPYPMHLAFMLTRKIATESFVPNAWGAGPPQHLDLDYSAFTSDKGLGGPSPIDPKHKKLFDTFTANSFRMNLIFQIDELRRSNVVFLRYALVQQIRRIKSIFKDPQDIALCDQALALIAKGQDSRWRHAQA